MTNIKKKIVIMCLVMMVTVITFVYSTLAYFTDSQSAQYGNLTAGRAAVEIIDITYPYGDDVAIAPGESIRILPGYEISKTVTARNTGSLPLFVRVSVQSDITLAEHARGREAEIDNSLVSYNINEDYWVFHEGYYYYRVALTGGTEATPLFTKVIFHEEMGNLYKDSTIKFKVSMEIVQANNNGASAIEASGWSDPTADTTAPVEEGGGV